MSIASRITAMQEHLQDDYDVLELAGADLTNVDKNIVNLKSTWKERLLYFINNGTDEVYDNWDKVTGEGEEISLNNTLEAKMKIVLKGNTSQNGTPTPTSPQDIHVVSGDNSIEVVGKNLWENSNYYTQIPTNNYTITDTGFTFTRGTLTGGKYIAKTIPVKAGKTYTFSSNNTVSSAGDLYMVLYSGNVYGTQLKVSYTGTLTYTALATENLYFTYIINSGLQSATVSNIQVEIGSTSSEYQPYTGASYPINLPEGMFLGWIPNTTYQDKIDKSTGINLFNNNDVKLNYTWNNTASSGRAVLFLKIKPNTTYTVSAENWNNLFYDIVFLDHVGATSYLYESGWNNPATTQSRTFTTTTGTNVLGLHFKYTSAGNVPMTSTMFENATIMLNEGSTALEYEPYGTNWYLKKEIGKVVLNGSENWNYSNDGTKKVFFLMNTSLPTNYLTEKATKLCNYFTYENVAWRNATSPSLCENTTDGNLLIFRYDDMADTNAFKTWLSNNNTTVYYPFATTTYETITNTTLIGQLEALEKGKSYTGQTNISQINNDNASIMSASALQNM